MSLLVLFQGSGAPPPSAPPLRTLMGLGRVVLLCLRATLIGLMLIGLAHAETRLAPKLPSRGTYRYFLVPIQTPTIGAHTHICVTGFVRSVRKEADRDWHVVIADQRGGGPTIVAEIIPTLPVPRPRVGTRITLCGIYRFDDKHQWHEIHPAESWWKESS